MGLSGWEWIIGFFCLLFVLGLLGSQEEKRQEEERLQRQQEWYQQQRVVPARRREYQYTSIAPPRAAPVPPHRYWSDSPPPYLPPPVPAQYADIFDEDELVQALRVRANAEGDAMRAASRSSKQKHRAEMNRLNGEASKLIFAKNNKGRRPGEVDLHGLYVQEAEQFAKQAVEDAKACGDSQISFIVGKGLHSKNGAARIKPAIERLMIECGLVAEVDPSNAGVLLVRLDGLAPEYDAGRVVRSMKSAMRTRSKRQSASNPRFDTLEYLWEISD